MNRRSRLKPALLKPRKNTSTSTAVKNKPKISKSAQKRQKTRSIYNRMKKNRKKLHDKII